MFKTILVTGGAGFIGSNFIRYMLKKYPDLKIVNLDKLTYAGCKENLKDIENDSRYKFIKGDICDAKTVVRAMKDCDVVVHAAAESHVDRSIKCASEFIMTNVLGTQVLLEVAKKFRIKRYIQISTDECYGSITKGAFNESSPLRPSSPYAASKAAADLLVRSCFVTHKLPVIIIRSSNNFGCWQYPEKLIPRCIILALQDKKVPLFGNGLQRREWLYVLDCVEAFDLIIHKGKTGEIYNVGSDNEQTNLEVIKFILKELDKSPRLIKFVKDRPGHDIRYSLNSSKVRKIGWYPKENFEMALKRTIRWYVNNPDYWQRLTKNKFVELYKKKTK